MTYHTAAPHILLNEISKFYPLRTEQASTYHQVLEDLTLALHGGEITALVGQSGCGKTTLLHILAGLEGIQSGLILPEHISTRSAVVFQDHRLLPWASLEKNLLLALASNNSLTKQEKQARVSEKLQALGLSGFAQSLPSALSGGMAQRAALGRALLQEPELLLMDEPFAALDAITRADMHDLLLSIQAKTPMTILFVTHDLEEATKLADRILVMDQGAIAHDHRIDLPHPRTPHSEILRQESESLRDKLMLPGE